MERRLRRILTDRPATTAATRARSVTPQPGPQTQFLDAHVDVGVFGGAAGGGKTSSLLLYPRHKGYLDNPYFDGIIFRSTHRQLVQPGGLWDRSMEFYGGRATPNKSDLRWDFSTRDMARGRLQLSYMQRDLDMYNFDGAEFTYVGLDEGRAFSMAQTFYMIGRLRGMSGLHSSCRIGTNPDPDSWLRSFLSWWIDDDTGYAIPSRSGVIRYFIRQDDVIQWADTRQALIDDFKADPIDVLSATFVPSKLSDNQLLLERDPKYKARLKALPAVERARLLGDSELGGNWNVRPKAGTLFKREWFTVLDQIPASIKRMIRVWDLGGTPAGKNSDPDWTVGMLLGVLDDGITLVIMDLIFMRDTPAAVESKITATAAADGRDVHIYIEQEPGQSGKYQVDAYQRLLPGYAVHAVKMGGDKNTAHGQTIRYGPASASAEQGRILVINGAYLDFMFGWLEALEPGVKHDDVPDVLAAGHTVFLGAPGKKGAKRRRTRR